jgi:Monoamine oxidase
MINKPSVPCQVDCPTDEERYAMLRYTLGNEDRPEDFGYIMEALKPPPDITTICPKGYGKKFNIAVIGGGVAGLAAAFELRKIGCSVTLFEATDRIGGRVYTHYFDNYHYGDLGAMRIPPSHETTWHYINLFKLPTSPFASKNINGLFYIRNSRAVNDPRGISVMQNIYPEYKLEPDEKNTPWFKLVGRIFEKYMMSLSPEKRQEIIKIQANYSDEIKSIDMLSCRIAYESTGLSQHAISMLGYLSAFDKSFFNVGLTEILQEAYTSDSAFTYKINGGTSNLPLALYRSLCKDMGGVYGNVSKDKLGIFKARIGFAVDGIYESPDGRGVILQYRKPSEFQYTYEKFDYVVCSIPFTSLRRMKVYPLFRVMKSQAIAELNYEIGQKTFLFLSDRFWEMAPPSARIVGGSSLTDLMEISVFYPSDHAMPIPNVSNGWTLRPGASPLEPGVLLASYNWGQNAIRLGNEQINLRLYDICRDIERIHSLPPMFIDEKLLSYKSLNWAHAPYIWGGACIAKPEDKTLFSYTVTQPEMDNKVFFAGEHISQKHAWQQGSLQTGMLAANDIAVQIKLRKA